jgi:hypothetical protein
MKNSAIKTNRRREKILELIPRHPSQRTASDILDVLRRVWPELTKRTVERDLAELSRHYEIACVDWSRPYGWQWKRGFQARYAARAGARGASGEGSGRSEAEDRKWLRVVLAPMEFAAEIERHVEGFSGRYWLLGEIRDWLASADGKRVLWITGEPGIGKTALCANLSTRDGQAVAGIHLCHHDNSDTIEPRRIVCSLAWQLSERLPAYRDALLAMPELEELSWRNEGALFHVLLVAPLREIAPPKDRLMFVVDALDELSAVDRKNVAGLIGRQSQHLPEWLRILVTSRVDQDIERIIGDTRRLPLEASDPNNRDDLHAFLKTRLEGSASAVLLDRLADASRGNFLYATEAVGAVQEGRLMGGDRARMPDSLGAIYGAWIARQYPDERRYADELRPLLEMVVAASNPLPMDLAGEALGWGDEYKAAKLLAALGPLFPSSGGTTRVFHKSLLDWLVNAESSGKYHVSARSGGIRIADALWARYTRNPASLGTYGYKNIVSHLLACRRWEAVEQLLCDFAYAYEKCKAGLVADLRRDYELAAREHPSPSVRMQAWSRFLRHSMHVLGRGRSGWGPERILLQLASEHAENDPVTRAAEAWLDKGCCSWIWPRKESRPAEPASAPISVLPYASAHALPGGRYVMDEDHAISVWDAADGELLWTEPYAEGDRGGILVDLVGGGNLPTGWLRDGSRLVAHRIGPVLDNPNPITEIELRDASRGTTLWRGVLQAAAYRFAECADAIVFAGDQGILIGCDRASGASLWRVTGEVGAYPRALEPLSGDTFLAWFKGSDQPPCIRSAMTGEVLARLDHEGDALQACCALDDGRIAGLTDHAVLAWDPAGVRAGTCVELEPMRVTKLEAPGTELSALPSARLLIYDSPLGGTREDYRGFVPAQVVNVGQGRCIALRNGRPGSEIAGALALVDGRVVTYDEKGTTFWNADTGAVLAELPGTRALALHDGRVVILNRADERGRLARRMPRAALISGAHALPVPCCTREFQTTGSRSDLVTGRGERGLHPWWFSTSDTVLLGAEIWHADDLPEFSLEELSGALPEAVAETDELAPPSLASENDPMREVDLGRGILVTAYRDKLCARRADGRPLGTLAMEAEHWQGSDLQVLPGGRLLCPDRSPPILRVWDARSPRAIEARLKGHSLASCELVSDRFIMCTLWQEWDDPLDDPFESAVFELRRADDLSVVLPRPGNSTALRGARELLDGTGWAWSADGTIWRLDPGRVAPVEVFRCEGDSIQDLVMGPAGHLLIQLPGAWRVLDIARNRLSAPISQDEFDYSRPELHQWLVVDQKRTGRGAGNYTVTWSGPTLLLAYAGPAERWVARWDAPRAILDVSLDASGSIEVATAWSRDKLRVIHGASG